MPVVPNIEPMAACAFCDLPEEGYYELGEDGRDESVQLIGEGAQALMAHPSCYAEAMNRPSCAERYGYEEKPKPPSN